MIPERPRGAAAPPSRLGGFCRRNQHQHGAPPEVTSVRSGSGLRRERRLERPEGRRHVVDVTEAPGLRGGADGGEACGDLGRDRGRAGQEAGGEGLRQGIRGAGAVPGAAQGRGAVPGVAQGDVRGQRQTEPGLLGLPAGVVRRLPLSPPKSGHPQPPRTPLHPKSILAPQNPQIPCQFQLPDTPRRGWGLPKTSSGDPPAPHGTPKPALGTPQPPMGPQNQLWGPPISPCTPKSLSVPQTAPSTQRVPAVGHTWGQWDPHRGAGSSPKPSLGTLQTPSGSPKPPLGTSKLPQGPQNHLWGAQNRPAPQTPLGRPQWVPVLQHLWDRGLPWGPQNYLWGPPSLSVTPKLSCVPPPQPPHLRDPQTGAAPPPKTHPGGVPRCHSTPITPKTPWGG